LVQRRWSNGLSMHSPSSARPLCATSSNPGHATPDSCDWSYKRFPSSPHSKGLLWLGTRVRNPVRPTSRRICDIARDSATQPPTGSESPANLQMRVHRLGADELPPARGSALRIELHHAHLHGHPPRPCACAARVPAPCVPVLQRQRRARISGIGAAPARQPCSAQNILRPLSKAAFSLARVCAAMSSARCSRRRFALKRRARSRGSRLSV
jgi:hypothetical protein